MDCIIEMTKAIDVLLLTWEPKPTLNEIIAAQVQSLAWEKNGDNRRCCSRTTPHEISMHRVVTWTLTA